MIDTPIRRILCELSISIAYRETLSQRSIIRNRPKNQFAARVASPRCWRRNRICGKKDSPVNRPAYRRRTGSAHFLRMNKNTPTFSGIFRNPGR